MKTKLKLILASIIVSMALMSSTCCYDDELYSDLNIYYPEISSIDTVIYYKTEKGNLNNIVDSNIYYKNYSSSIYIPMYEYLNNDLIINVNNEYIDTISNVKKVIEETSCGSHDVFYYYFNKKYTNARNIRVKQKDN